MPNYDFKCPDCGHTEELFLQMSQAFDKVGCPQCGKLMHRLIGPGSGVIFKGKGWPGKDIEREKA